VLEAKELKRRIDAARTLRGLTQAQLAKLFVAEGFGTQDIGRIERGGLDLTRARRRSLADLLQVPETWFTEEHLDLTATMDDKRLERITDDVAAVLENQRTILANQEFVLRRMVGLLPDDDARLAEEFLRHIEEAGRTPALDNAEHAGERRAT